MKAFVRAVVRRGQLVGLGAVLAAATLAGDAEARGVTSEDGMFSVDVEATCFIEPRELRSEEDCAGVDVTAITVPTLKDPLTRVGYGVVRGAGTGPARPIVGTVTLVRTPSHLTAAAPDQVAAERHGEEIAESLGASLPPGAHLRSLTSKIAWGKNVPVVRTTLVTEGAMPSGIEGGTGPRTDAPDTEPNPTLMHEHREVLTAVGGRDLYMTVWSGTREQAPALARLADAAATTTDLKPQGRPTPNLNPWPGRLLFMFGVLGLILLRFRLSKKRPKRPT
jgi:hypothetical protein